MPEGTLTRNLGLDLIVVVTKTDYITELEKDFDYKDEHFDFIQQAVSYILILKANQYLNPHVSKSLVLFYISGFAIFYILVLKLANSKKTSR